MHRFNPNLLMKLHDALALLPDAMPRKTRAELFESEHIMSGFGLESEIIDDDWGTPRVTPSGIQIILELYYNDYLPMKRKAKPTNAPELEAYIKSEAELLERTATLEMGDRARQERRDTLIANPSLAREEELIYPLLTKIFWEHGLRGNAEMEIGGFLVHKCITPYRSNSGKRNDYAVSFSWTGSDGKTHEAIKDSLYANNRRNDSKRSYGLPE